MTNLQSNCWLRSVNYAVLHLEFNKQCSKIYGIRIGKDKYLDKGIRVQIQHCPSQDQWICPLLVFHDLRINHSYWEDVLWWTSSIQHNVFLIQVTRNNISHQIPVLESNPIDLLTYFSVFLLFCWHKLFNAIVFKRNSLKKLIVWVMAKDYGFKYWLIYNTIYKSTTGQKRKYCLACSKL